MQEWASLIFVVVSLYMTVSAIFAVMFWVIVVRLELTPLLQKQTLRMPVKAAGQ